MPLCCPCAQRRFSSTSDSCVPTSSPLTPSSLSSSEQLPRVVLRGCSRVVRRCRQDRRCAGLMSLLVTLIASDRCFPGGGLPTLCINSLLAAPRLAFTHRMFRLCPQVNDMWATAAGRANLSSIFYACEPLATEDEFFFKVRRFVVFLFLVFGFLVLSATQWMGGWVPLCAAGCGRRVVLSVGLINRSSNPSIALLCLSRY